jgi:hypothetical protein
MKKINPKNAAKSIPVMATDNFALSLASILFNMFLLKWDDVKDWSMIPGYFFPVRADHGLPGVLFTVQGSKYTGLIAVIYHLGNFEVYLVNSDYSVSKAIGLVGPDELVRVIDQEIGHIDPASLQTEEDRNVRKMIEDTIKMNTIHY